MEHERAAKQLQDQGLYKDMTVSALVKKVCYQDWTEATDDVKQQCFDQAIGSIVTEKTGRGLNGRYQEPGLIPDETMLTELIPERRLDRIPQKEFAKVGKSLIKVLGEFGKKKNNSKHMTPGNMVKLVGSKVLKDSTVSKKVNLSFKRFRQACFFLIL